MKKNNRKIINSANRTLSRELSSIKNLKSTFNYNFCEAVNIIYNTKGKIVITGVGKSAHIGNKISATLTSTGTCLLYTSPSPRDISGSRMPSSA